jgi:electron transport complex protein RnfA
MRDIIVLMIFSGLSLNILLQMGLGIRNIGDYHGRIVAYTVTQGGALFLSVLMLWALFSYVFSPLNLGYVEYFLLFPLIKASGAGFEAARRKFFPSLARVAWTPDAALAGGEQPSLLTAYDALTLTAVVLTVRFAGSFAEAAAFSLGFSLGNLMTIVILREINRRSSLERVPNFLRGAPLLFIAMGLLSLIFSSAATILLQVLEGR